MSDLAQQLQATLGTAYTLERELGGGGMSRVFVAIDAALNRRVVVKLLAPELAQELSTERFAREIKLAAALQDPHIVPVHSAGDAGGLPFYTMPFVEGESLRARLMRGPVPLPEAVSILRDVALALEYAHARGVVHRDIKPENVLLAGRTAVVTDFGIAKAVSAARTGTEPVTGTLTSVGQSVGTPAYMAPEQVAGDAVDHRADLYAWGVMAYELLAGRHPFADKTSGARLMAAQVAERPRALVDAKPGLPPPLTALVMQCLEKDPAARAQSAGQVVEALDSIYSPAAASVMNAVETTERSSRRLRLAASLGFVVVALAVGTAWLVRNRASTGVPAEENAKTIAVLPFESLGDSADAYFADGITDAVRGKLTSLTGVTVIARASSAQYRRTTKPPAQIAKELGVRYLLTGTVRFAGAGDSKQVQVSPELVEVSGDRAPQSRWQEPFDADVRDVFRVQGDIAGKVADAMRVQLADGEQVRLAKVPTHNAAAYDAYLRGEAAWNGGIESDPALLRAAIGFFEQAVASDSGMVDAWGALAQAYSRLFFAGIPTTRLRESALAAARRAVALDTDGVVGHRAMASYYRYVVRDRAAELRESELALRVAPRSAALLGSVASAKSDLGRFEESLRDREAAIQLDPRNVGLWVGQAQTFLRLHRTAEARATALRAVALAPSSTTTLMNLIAAEVASGNLGGARQAVAEALRNIPAPRVLADVAIFNDMGWILDAASEQQLLVLGPEAFDNDPGQWTIIRAEQYSWRGDSALARAWGDSARRGTEAELKEGPQDPQNHVFLGLALAYAGRGREALVEMERGLALAQKEPSAQWSLQNAYLAYAAARVALLAGDRAKALDLLDETMRRRYYVTPAWLRLDPTWKPLYGDPRFERLASAP